MRNASRWGLALGVMWLALGANWLSQYLSSGAIYVPKEKVLLTGPGALTVPIGTLGGGVALIGIALFYRLRLRARRNQSAA